MNSATEFFRDADKVQHKPLTDARELIARPAKD